MKDSEKEIKCGNCGRLLAKGVALSLSIKCPRCKTLNHVRDMIPGSELHDGHSAADHQHYF